ncbi:MAG: hypothetical protein RL154_1257, partial [Pseudomonadota bacterium]
IGLPTNIWSANLLTFALVWDMIALSFALAFRIRTLQDENTHTERMLMLTYRHELIGKINGNIAHQWRTPLGEIGSILTTIKAKLLYSDISKDEMIELIDRSETIFKHLSQTVNTFMDMLSPSTINQKFNLSDTIIKAVDFIKPMLNVNGINIILNIQNNCYIHGNENAIKQVLLIILENAKDAILENKTIGGQINISMLKTDIFYILCIKDNGGGINKAIKKTIFEPFMTTKASGSGIGLFIAKTIIEKQHNGNLDCISNQNSTEFIISLMLLSN